jgi:lipopolysaccharide biosynthesis regulator YciM
MFIFTFLRRAKKRTKRRDPYVLALHLLLDGKKEDAREQLKKSIKQDTENIDAYIKLGDIYRETHQPVKAAKIHQNLLIRGDISDSEKESVLQRLVLDYKTANMLDKAIEFSEQLVQRNKKNIDNQKLLLSFYEKKGDWDKAFFCRQSINKWLKSRDQRILALYKIESGLKFIQKGAEREGRIRFREAFKLDKTCIPAYLQLGESYRRVKRNEDALKVLRDFSLKNPEWAHLAFEPLREVFFDLGRYGEIEAIYQQVIQKKPKNPAVYIHLAQLYKKQGKLDQAEDLCHQVLEKHPESVPTRHLLVSIYKQLGKESRALEEAIKGLTFEMDKKAQFICSSCGTSSDKLLWRCPKCHEWDTYTS